MITWAEVDSDLRGHHQPTMSYPIFWYVNVHDDCDFKMQE